MTRNPPDGKVALVTGANTGIGRVTARELALRGHHVFLASRSEVATQPVLDEIGERSGGTAKAEFLPLDLGDLDSVRGCAERFLARGLPLHVLVANAGLAGRHGLTPSGFELMFGVCHVGHFLLTRLLLARLRESAPARVVVVASRAHRRARALDFDALRRPTRSFGGVREYCVAKLANVLFARELGRRLAGTGVTAYALHPGVVASDIWRVLPWPIESIAKRFMITVEEGAATSLHCATDPGVAAETGKYYANCRAIPPSRLAADDALAERLWNESERWTADVPEIVTR